MPEGPECHHICDILKSRLVGKTIICVEVLSGRYVRHGDPEGWSLLEGSFHYIRDIGVKGKFIYFVLGDEISIFNTLGMTGQWCSEYDIHCRVVFHLDSGESVYFRDIRNFGTIKIVKGVDKLNKKLKLLGSDILVDRLGNSEVLSLFRKRGSWTLPKFLMNQGYLSGVGNYIKCEGLHRSGLSPHSRIEELSDEDIMRVYVAVCEVARASYLNKGASFQTYRDPDKNKGKYSFSFLVYGKDHVLGYPIIVDKTMDGRSTYWSPSYLANLKKG